MASLSSSLCPPPTLISVTLILSRDSLHQMRSHQQHLHLHVLCLWGSSQHPHLAIFSESRQRRLQLAHDIIYTWMVGEAYCSTHPDLHLGMLRMLKRREGDGLAEGDSRRKQLNSARLVCQRYPLLSSHSPEQPLCPPLALIVMNLCFPHAGPSCWALPPPFPFCLLRSLPSFLSESAACIFRCPFLPVTCVDHFAPSVMLSPESSRHTIPAHT